MLNNRKDSVEGFTRHGQQERRPRVEAETGDDQVAEGRDSTLHETRDE